MRVPGSIPARRRVSTRTAPSHVDVTEGTGWIRFRVVLPTLESNGIKWNQMESNGIEWNQITADAGSTTPRRMHSIEGEHQGRVWTLASELFWLEVYHKACTANMGS